MPRLLKLVLRLEVPPVRLTVPKAVVPAIKVTDPVGVWPPDRVAVKVTALPTAGLRLEAARVRPGAAFCTARFRLEAGVATLLASPA